jgi:hypothetical protein
MLEATSAVVLSVSATRTNTAWSSGPTMLTISVAVTGRDFSFHHISGSWPILMIGCEPVSRPRSEASSGDKGESTARSRGGLTVRKPPNARRTAALESPCSAAGSCSRHDHQKWPRAPFPFNSGSVCHPRTASVGGRWCLPSGTTVLACGPSALSECCATKRTSSSTASLSKVLPTTLWRWK